MKRIIVLFQILFLLTLSLSCGEKPKTDLETATLTINLPQDIKELLSDDVIISIYDNGERIAENSLNNILTDNRDFFNLNHLKPGEHNIAIYLTGPNTTVVYMLDRKKVNLLPDIENRISMELAQPIKFNSKVINLSPNQELLIEAKIDSSRLPEGVTDPEIKWTIDNILNGNEELGTIISNNKTATIKGPSTLPSSKTHYLGASYEVDGIKYISLLKINYLEE